MKAVLRPSRLNASPLVAATLHRASPLVFNWHYHQQFEMVLILGGSGVRHVGNSLEEYLADDLVLMGPGLPHRYASSLQGAPCDFVVVHFDPALFAPAMNGEPTLAALASLLGGSMRGIAFKGNVVKGVSSLIQQLPALSTLGRWATLLHILERLSEPATGRELSSTAFEAGKFTASDVKPLDRICRYIQQNLARPLSLAEVASVAAMSASTFSRFFRRATGLSFVEYVNEMRLRTATLLLLETNATIKEVAHKAGYASKSYFHRKFVAARGVTPIEYRESRRAPKQAVAKPRGPQRR